MQCLQTHLKRQPRRIRRLARPLAFVAGWVAVCWAACVEISAAELAGLPRVEAPGLPVYGCRVITSYDHSPQAFTQGLVYHEGYLYESTGLRGASSLRKLDPQTGRELKILRLPKRYFAEGLTIFDSRIYQLTWTSGVCFVYGVEGFGLQHQFSYPGQGWGLTQDGRMLIMSDGSHRLRFIDPESFATERVLEVSLLGRPLPQLNELEYIRGEVYANVWQTRSVVRIDPVSGRVVAVIDLAGLSEHFPPMRRVDVPNGIAYDPVGNRIFITGKLWPRIFHVALFLLEGGSHGGR